MPSDRKTRTVFNSLESLRADIERTVDASEEREGWRITVRGVLIYHMGAMYDEGAGYTKDLETSIAILREQVESLKRQLPKKDDADDQCEMG